MGDMSFSANPARKRKPNMTIQELRWPPGWPRSRSRNDWGARFNYQGRQITIDRAEELLRDALRRMCATRVAVTLQPRRRCGLLHAQR